MSVEIPRDHLGRPKVPDPKTGKIKTWTRATTLASTISDRYGLEKWAQRNLVKGMAIGGEKLLLQAVAAGDDRDSLTAVVEAAFERAQSSSAADTGTALHRITERLDAGEEFTVPEAYRADIEAYQVAMQLAGVKLVDGWLERFVVVPQVDAAGTADRLVMVGNFFLPMIADLKTGQDALKYGAVEIAAQLAIYSRASHWWDGTKLHPMPKVDQQNALVMHMPAGQGKCDLYLIDLERGWKIVELCHAARMVRKSKGLTRPLIVEESLSPAASDVALPHDESDDALRDRIRDIVRALEGAPLPIPWPAGVTPPKQLKDGAWTPAERVRILKWCEQVAPRTTAAPF